jgi:Uma2 family endonuclease
MVTAVSRRLFTADEYLRMVEVGILAKDDRVELIDGEIVAMTPIGPRHAAAVDRANKTLVSAVGDRAIVRVQSSIRLNLFRQPEPDLVLLRPKENFYVDHLPGARDIFLIIEIAESSFEYDFKVKARMYAESGVPEYWIADLDAGRVTCFTDLRQNRSVREFHPGESMAPALMPEVVVAADAFLIPRSG